MKKILLILFTLELIISCSRLPSRTEDNEGWYWNMRNIMVSYYRAHLELPTNVDDLINYLESDSDLLSDSVFDSPYEFLKKNSEKIIIVHLKLGEILDPEELVKLKTYEEESALEDVYSCMFFNNTKSKNLICFISRHDSLSMSEKY